MSESHCADCKAEIGKDAGPKDGWQLDDGRTVCHACCVADTTKAQLEVAQDVFNVLDAGDRDVMTTADPMGAGRGPPGGKARGGRALLGFHRYRGTSKPTCSAPWTK